MIEIVDSYRQERSRYKVYPEQRDHDPGTFAKPDPTVPHEQHTLVYGIILDTKKTLTGIICFHED